MPRKTDDQRLQALLAIAELLAPRAREIATAITEAVRAPGDYLAAHAARMNERAISAPPPNLPWIALIDALGEAGALVELDWKTEAEDVEAAVRALAKGFRLPAGDDDRSTWELLEEAAQALRKKRLQLAQLDMGSDAYPLVVVPIDRFATLETLAERCGFGAVRAFGDQLDLAREDRIARARPPGKTTGRRSFTRGDDACSIETFASADGMNARFEASFAGPAGTYATIHYFPGDASARRAADQEVRAWLADGFREGAAPGGASRGTRKAAWIGPFPEDGRYFAEGKRKVSCLARRGDAVWVADGVAPTHFGQEQIFHHARSAQAAARDLAERIKDYTTSGYFDAVEITRDEAIARYARKRRR